MLDIGWTEVLVIGVVALFIIGPRDIPKALRTVGQWAAKVRALAREFRETVDDAVRETELDEVRRQVESVRTGFREQVRNTIDPGGELTKSLEGMREPLAGGGPDAPAAAPAPEAPGDGAPKAADDPDAPPAKPAAPKAEEGPGAPPAQAAAAQAEEGPGGAPAKPAAPKAKEGPVGLRHLAGGGGDPGSA